jgi:hypothetical protein
MLISMPTGTSTIFGVFQVIPSSQVLCQVVWRELHAEVEPRSSSKVAQVRKSDGRTRAANLTVDISLLDKATSLLDKVLS